MSAFELEFFVSVTWSEIDFVAEDRYFGDLSVAVLRAFELVPSFGNVKTNVALAESTGAPVVPGVSPWDGVAGSVPWEPPPPHALSTTVPARTYASDDRERIRNMKVLTSSVSPRQGARP